MDHQRLDVADVGKMAHELRGFDELDAGGLSALDAEGHDRARAVGQIFLRQCMVLAALEARITDPAYLRVRFEKLGHRERIFAVALHPHVQRFQPLQQQKRVKRRQRRTESAQRFHARLHGIAEVAERFVKSHTVITARRLGHLREIAVVPWEFSRLDDHAAHRRAVAADVLGRRVHDDVGAEFDRPAQVR